ncbi:MAG: DUF2470 domain-containing protein [Bacteroidota bacterium]
MANTTFSNRKFMDYAINHVNADHHKEMVMIVQEFTDLTGVSDVTVMDYDAEGMELIVVQEEKEEQKMRVDFPSSLQGPHDFRTVLVEMVKTARTKSAKKDNPSI